MAEGFPNTNDMDVATMFIAYELGHHCTRQTLTLASTDGMNVHASGDIYFSYFFHYFNKARIIIDSGVTGRELFQVLQASEIDVPGDLLGEGISGYFG